LIWEAESNKVLIVKNRAQYGDGAGHEAHDWCNHASQGFVALACVCIWYQWKFCSLNVTPRRSVMQEPEVGAESQSLNSHYSSFVSLVFLPLCVSVQVEIICTLLTRATLWVCDTFETYCTVKESLGITDLQIRHFIDSSLWISLRKILFFRIMQPIALVGACLQTCSRVTVLDSIGTFSILWISLDNLWQYNSKVLAEVR
jgi:hypothetical protein